FFNNLSFGLYSFGFLIPLVIIYLIRPRPVQMEIPSLMFFLTSRDNPKQQSFLRRISRDWLFLLHILLFCLLAFALLQPFMKYQHDVTSKHTVLVIDVSASSKTVDGSSTRFEKGIDAARQAVGGTNTIILAKNTPAIVLRDAPASDALEMLRALRPSDTPSAIGDAMILGGEVLNRDEGRVVVISDFANNEGIEPQTAQAALAAQKIVVDLINTATGAHRRNIGITNIDIDEDSTTVFVHNFESEPANVRLHVADLTRDLMVPALGTETYSFKTPEKVTKITLDNNDDFDADDIAYLSAPEKKPIKIQLITNNESVFLANALLSTPEIEVNVAEPPVVPKGDFDIYIIHNIRPRDVLPGTYEEIADRLKAGKSAIIAASDEYLGVDFRGVLPVVLKGMSNKTNTAIDQVNSFTKNIDFGGMDAYYNATLTDSAFSIVSDGKGNSIIAYKQIGSGKVIWYGIMEKHSDFRVHPNYPIFWSKLVEFLVNQESIKNLNIRTGETIILDEVRNVKTPSKIIKTNALIADEAGIYEINGRRITANLINEKESTINPDNVIGASAGKEIELRPVKEEREMSWEIPLLVIGLVLLILEIIYIKFRGDL
ncbi:BatA domain-containing protein, partial [Candidatus Woesearchaeota archaeon]|nr:BatA domain-containing protein [Candidatus Woesearchaeota archaeon]